MEFHSAAACPAALRASFPAELAEWMLREMADNRLPRNQARSVTR